MWCPNSGVWLPGFSFNAGDRVTHIKWAYLGVGTVVASGHKRVTVKWDKIQRCSVNNDGGAYYEPKSFKKVE